MSARNNIQAAPARSQALNRFHSPRILGALICGFALLAAYPLAQASNLAKLPTTGMLWLSDANAKERNRSFDAANRFKLKSIQELAVMRFDTTPIAGREILSARLLLKPARPVKVRYLRVSTVTRRWIGRRDVSPRDLGRASTWRYADAAAKRPWAWPGSVFADVIMSSGNSIASWTQTVSTPGGWLSAAVPPQIIYALATGLSDGLAVADGGSIALNNNYFHGSGTAERPYLLIELGQPLVQNPQPPMLRQPKVDATGVAIVEIASGSDTLGFHVSVEGKPLQQWRVPRPGKGQSERITLDGLDVGRPTSVTAAAVSRSAAQSRPVTLEVTHARAPDFLVPSVPGPHSALVRAKQDKTSSELKSWAPHIKVSPLTGQPVAADRANAQGIFQNNEVGLTAARGEYVSLQLMLPQPQPALASRTSALYRITSDGLVGPRDFRIRRPEIELFKQWYSRTRSGVWQPAYAVPLRHDAPVFVPDPQRALADQQTQGIWVDIYVPKNAPPGRYRGTLNVTRSDGIEDAVQIHLQVYDFTLPDRLTFWAELNTYHVPRRDLHAYYRLAHQNRAVFMPWVLAPRLRGKGSKLRLDFQHYDRVAGPLLSGHAFAHNRRQRQPLRTMYLPFDDSWPTPLTRQTYAYDGYWPGRGDAPEHIVAHYESAPYIGDALSTQYKAAIHAAQKQFVEHFAARGWNQTEMHAFYGGKNMHRIKFGTNRWWTTDEPYHWDDWLALQYLTRHWMQGPSMGATRTRTQWRSRADISRPQWLGRVLDGGANTIYFASGNFADPIRLRRFSEHQHIDVRAYGGFNHVDESNTSTITQMVRLWLSGANAFLPWQTVGNAHSLDVNDNVVGAAIMIPGGRLGYAVLADFRLRAARDAQQLVEYLEILRRRNGMTRAQLLRAIGGYLPSRMAHTRNSNPDDADAVRAHAWRLRDLLALKHAVALAIMRLPHVPAARR